VIIQALASAFLCSHLASLKSRDAVPWFFAGLFFGVLGLIAAAGLPPSGTSTASTYSTGAMLDASGDGEARRTSSELIRRFASSPPKVDWRQIIGIDEASKPTPPELEAIQLEPMPPRLPNEPVLGEGEYEPNIRFRDSLSSKKWKLKTAEAKARHEVAHLVWEQQVSSIQEHYQSEIANWRSLRGQAVERERVAEMRFQEALHDWQKRSSQLELQGPESLSSLEARCKNGDETALVEFLTAAYRGLENSSNGLISCSAEWLREKSSLYVCLQVPTANHLAKAMVHLGIRANSLLLGLPTRVSANEYEDLICQIVLVALHVSFGADPGHGFDRVLLEGIADVLDERTGLDSQRKVLVLETTRERFMELDLSRARPLACFAYLGGHPDSELHQLREID